MLIAALALIVTGVLLTAGALAPQSFDFAIALLPGWHVTILPAPPWVGVLVMLSGIALLVCVLWR
jgi:hypothetical protein